VVPKILYSMRGGLGRVSQARKIIRKFKFKMVCSKARKSLSGALNYKANVLVKHPNLKKLVLF